MKYQIGDTVELSMLSLVGIAGNSADSIWCTLTLPKEIDESVTSITVDEVALAYVRASGNSTNYGATDLVLAPIKNAIGISILGSYSKCVIYGIYISTLKFTFK